jgi:L-fuconate dehydratase
MKSVNILRVETEDRRFPLEGGAGTDAIHQITEYSFAVTRLVTDCGLTGSGIVLTLGKGNDVVCAVIATLGELLPKVPVDELMSDFGNVSRKLAENPSLRWLGPHKGVVHLALASLTNACFDLWAKARGLPLWKLLLDLNSREVVNLLDLSYLEEDLTATSALEILQGEQETRPAREAALSRGYPGYDTSVGWFQYDDTQLRENAKHALGSGFRALKLKVGSKDPSRDVRRATLLRELAGPDCQLMIDANQQWSVPEAAAVCEHMRGLDLFWIEEPTHPDDVQGHVQLAKRLAPMRLALGEHVPNRVLFTISWPVAPRTLFRPIARGWPESLSFSPSACSRASMGCQSCRTSARWDRSISTWSCLTMSPSVTRLCSWNTFHTCATISCIPRASKTACIELRKSRACLVI